MNSKLRDSRHAHMASVEFSLRLRLERHVKLRGRGKKLGSFQHESLEFVLREHSSAVSVPEPRIRHPAFFHPAKVGWPADARVAQGFTDPVNSYTV